MTGPERTRLRRILERFYSEYDFAARVRHDPIEFPRRYSNPGDIEVSGLIASCLAYGRVDLFKPVIEKIHSIMGKSPYSFLAAFDVKKYEARFSFKYRFNESRDILALLFIIRELLARHSSIGNAFRKHDDALEPNTGKGITGFVGEIMSIDMTGVYGRDIRPAGLGQLFPSPLNGSACKRMNLFLRWMVRDRDIDFGIWKGISKNRLVIPLDTHIARIGRCIGLTKRKSSDWKTAVEITEALKGFDSEDPLRYDFALCHHGISGMCAKGDAGLCEDCDFSALRYN